MRTSLALLPLALCAAANAQVLTPLDLSGVNGIPMFVTAPSHDVAYAGVNLTGSANTGLYGRTVDGGGTWTTNTVPDPLDRGISSLHALDDSTVFASMQDFVGGNGGAIWRTTDGGDSWTQLTTTEFAAGFLNFSYFASADSGVAVGDPNGGYFEIWTTGDGGTTWTRTPQADIPVPGSGEFAFVHDYTAVGHRIWFNTSEGRIFMSYDLGLTWTLSPIPLGPPSSPNVQFSDALHGASHHVLSLYPVNITDDGGASWTTQPVTPSINIMQIQAIKGIPGTFVFTAQGPIRLLVTVDNFQSYSLLDDQLPYSYGSFCMYDASIGWIASSNTFEDSAMIRIGNVLNGLADGSEACPSFQLFPNPAASGAALVTVDLGDAPRGTLTLTDAQGRGVRTLAVQGTNGRQALILDLHDLPAGVYGVALRAEDAQAVGRLIVR